MTRDRDTDPEEGAGIGENPTLPVGTRVDASLYGSDSMDALLALVAAAPPVRIGRHDGPGIEAGTLVDDTYRVRRRLGGGGMGVVYLAEHVELQRQVALKLHLGEVDSQELARLRREARVMARLSHPNVLVVHGMGAHEGRMFIAMEFAEGGTLKTWLEAGPRSWRETVEMLAQAGRGLAAAHRVGVVHRDFKPDNVLIGADGRPRVADFGLARRWEDPTELPTGPSTALLEDAHRFTVTGAVVGTPAYMSPEQFDGIEVGPASDQFSFCVVLYEALVGRRPFSGRTTLELAAAVHEGELAPVPAGVRIPRRLLSILQRGLQPLPGDRHPSMEALVAALEHVRGARARRTRWAVGAATLGVTLLLGNGVAVMAAAEPCENAEAGLGAAWDGERREAVSARWPAEHGEEQAAALAAIDGWATQWGAQRREVCEATRVREEQSELAFTLRMACLERMAARLDALTGELAEEGAGAAEPRQGVLEHDLPVLAECEDVEALDALVNRLSSRTLRGSAEQDRAWTEADALLTRAVTRQRLGRSGWAELAEEALGLAERHGLVVVESTALVLLAHDRLARGDAKGAAALEDRALPLALSVGHDSAAAELVLGRAETSIAAGRPDDAAIHLSYFDALVTRIRNPDDAEGQRRRAGVVRGRMHLARGEAEAAIEALAPLADDPALELLLRSAALRGLGKAYLQQGRPSQALETWERLATLIERERGADDPELVPVLNSMANVRIDHGELELALAVLSRAETIATGALGSDHAFVTTILTNRGLAERLRGRLQEARELQERSLAIRARLLGEEHHSLAYPLDELGELARLRGDLDGALVHLAQARRLREGNLGPDNPLVAETLTLEAKVHLDRAEIVRARELLDRAYAIVGRDGSDPLDRAEVELLLARVHGAQGNTTARQWATQAQEHATQADRAGRTVRDEAEAWLAAHPAGPQGSE